MKITLSACPGDGTGHAVGHALQPGSTQPACRANSPEPTMRPIINRYGDTHGILAGRPTGVSDARLPVDVRREAPSLPPLLEHVVRAQKPMVVSSPGQRMGNRVSPLIIVTHGHFAGVLAARALGLAAESGRLFANLPASVSVIGDHRCERCVGVWNADTTMAERTRDQRPVLNGSAPVAAPLLVPAGGRTS